MIPNYFNYSVSDDELKMSQILGLIKFEFGITEDFENPGNAYFLEVQNEGFDYDQLHWGNLFYLEKIADYSEESRAVKTFLEDFNYE